MRAFSFLGLVTALVLTVFAAGELRAQGMGGGDPGRRGYTYGLSPEEIAPGVYVFWGAQEPMTPENGANIVNTGFIVGDESVLAIDTGPTRLYGEEMLATIAKVTDKPVRMAVVTHHHFDHAFGMSVFKKANIPTMMHFGARPLLLRDGSGVLQFMEILVGANWVSRIEVDRPTRVTNRVETFDLGNRKVVVTPFENGHTPGDLVIYDEKTKTLFAGDLAFVGRTPTIPHADIPTWLDQIDIIEAMPWDRLVPGHGPLVTDRAQLTPMADYLRYLDDYVKRAVANGETLADSLDPPPPERFRDLAEIGVEYQRALLKLFRDVERQELDTTVR
ncbi:MAG: MBL fold metallo-hydrolase [Rhodospirillaceae bacterium]|nr:MBL fold metallo-hydrolase [Rhodospirillaceae bacterium]